MTVRRFALVMYTSIIISLVLLAAIMGRLWAPSAAQLYPNSDSQKRIKTSTVASAQQKTAAIELETKVCESFDTWALENVEVKSEVVKEESPTDTIHKQPSLPVADPIVAAPPAAPPAAPSPTTIQPEPSHAIDPKVERGRQAAIQRRAALKRLIALDPRAAIAQAVPYDVRRSLPVVIQAELEKPISARGDLLLAAQLPRNRNESPSYSHEAIIGNRIYNAHVYGWRSNQASQKNIPLQGIAIDGDLAVDENSTRLLSAAEISDRKISTDTTCPVSGEPAKATVVAEAAGITYPLCSAGHISNMESSIRAAQNGGAAGTIARAAPTAWTTGVKKVLVMRVDCADEPGDPVSFSDATQRMIEIDAFMRANSNGLTSFTATITPTVRLPQTADWYRNVGGVSAAYYDAQVACRAAGYETNLYDLDIVTYTNLGGPAGQAYVGAKGCWASSFAFWILAHELGHNLGLYHSAAWISSDGTPNGAGGHDEYGENQDAMGYYGGGNSHYNPIAKNMLGWLDDARIQDVTASGTYHVLPHDTTASGIAALRIRQADGNDYWFSTRALQGENGVFVHWKQPFMSCNSELLDFTPLTHTPATEAMLPGMSLYDATPTAITATNLRMYADGSADVQINLDSNRLPIGGLNLTTRVDGSLIGTNIVGWTLDPDAAPGSNQVKVKFDNGIELFATASTPRPDVNSLTGYAGDHGFIVPIPSSLMDFSYHQIRIYGIDTTNNYEMLLSNQYAKFTDGVPDTVPPTALIYTPKDGDVVSGLINIFVEATDNVSVTNVEFFLDGISIGNQATPAYFITWDTSTVGNGSHTLTATALDGAGHLTTSAPVTVTVNNGGVVNRAPLVSAGPDLAITVPAGATLDGTVSDDGLPTATLTQTWTMDSGPGTVTFGDATAVDTTATFSVVGIYVLRLTANDGALSAFDTVTVVVSPAPPINVAPTVDAGLDLAVTFPVNATLDGTVSDDGLPTATLTQTWTMDSGPGTVTFGDAMAVDTTATFSVVGTYELRLTANDGALSAFDTVTVVVSPAPPGNIAPTVDAGPDLAVTLPANATLDGTVSDDGLPTATLTQTWTMDSGPGIVTFSDATAVDTTAAFTVAGTYVLRLTATDGALSVNDTVTVTVSSAPSGNAAPVVDAGASFSLTLPHSAALHGSATDDGLPGGPVTQLWTVDSGPGTVTCSDATAAVTTATFSQTGDYVLRLSAQDGALTGSDTVTISVLPPGKTTINNQTDCGFGGGFALFLGILGWCATFTGARRRK